MKTKDTIIVLGGGINPDGSLKEPSLNRVKMAAKLFHEGAANHIIASSKWRFQLNFIPPCTLAAAMKKELIKLNVPENNIFMEDKSYDTIGNAYFTKTLFLESNHWKNILIITSKFHKARSFFLFNKILGPQYNIDFAITEDGLQPDELKKQLKIEKILLMSTQHALKHIKDGDAEMFKKWLFEKHPAYIQE